MPSLKKPKILLAAGVLLFGAFAAFAQVDPKPRSLLELGIDQPLIGHGPQGLYAYYYYNDPDFINTNTALRAAIAPAYVDSELGFKHVIWPYTDIGVGLAGGAYGDDYYEVRQGKYYQNETFNGHGGSTDVSLYQLLDPGMLIPLNFVARGGFHFTTYDTADQTAANFKLPQDQFDLFTRVGLRFAGKEPILYPDLGMEVSVWFERQWRLHDEDYGFSDDRSISPGVSLYWVYAEIHYAWTNTGQKVSFAVTAGDSSNADRFSAWRLGGVLPLISEFPLMIPGYYYEELTAEKFVHLYGSYDIPLDRGGRWTFRLEGGAADAEYLKGFEQPSEWQTGVGGGLTFTPKSKRFSIVARYGYGFNALRNGQEGAQSIGLLFQYDFDAKKNAGNER